MKFASYLFANFKGMYFLLTTKSWMKNLSNDGYFFLKRLFDIDFPGIFYVAKNFYKKLFLTHIMILVYT
jgi:hypothetical protein